MIDARPSGKLALGQLPRPELEPQQLGECAAAGTGPARLGIYHPGERQLFDHGARTPDPRQTAIEPWLCTGPARRSGDASSGDLLRYNEATNRPLGLPVGVATSRMRAPPPGRPVRVQSRSMLRTERNARGGTGGHRKGYERLLIPGFLRDTLDRQSNSSSTQRLGDAPP